MSNIVFTCTASKAFPASIRARDYTDKVTWRNDIKNILPKYQVYKLYSGAYWNEVMKVYERYPEHNYYVLSSGLGLISFEEYAPSYEASYSERSLDTVPLDWCEVKLMEGLISTSNEYATVAKRLGLTLLAPSGRKWLPYLGGTGFTLAPKLMSLFLSGKDLKSIFESLPEATTQPMPPRRPSATTQVLAHYYMKDMPATQLRKRINEAGYAISVQRAFRYVKQASN